ncbi:retrovirus-related pol polyprotein from transposon TNT 1-94 [Tanacetum coccineum]
METISLLVSQSAQNGWKIYQMDVKSAFLNGVLDEVVYIEQHAKVGEETKVLKLKKALYGLAPRAWNTRIDSFLKRMGNRDVQLTHVMSRDQAADIFTKALPAELFNLCKQKMGMKDARDVSLREEFVG